MRKIKFTKKNADKKRTKKRKSLQKEFSWKRFIFNLACFLFLAIVIYTLFYSKLAEIKNISVEGNIIVSSDSIVQEIQSQIQNKNFLYIPKKNFFFISEKELQQNILNSFPKIKNAEVKKVFPNQIKISVNEYDLIPVVCIDNENGQCFILDKNGTLIENADFNSPKLQQNKTVLIIDKNKEDIVETGKEFIFENKLNNIIFLGEELTYTLQTKIQQPYTIPARGASEVRFDTSEGWYLQVDTVDNPEITLKVLNLFFEQGLKEEIRRYDLEYVDARTNEKIFYKYDKEEEIISDETENDEKN